MRHFILACLLSLPGIAHAGTVSIEVRGVDGKPLAGAVVQVESARASAPRIGGPYSVAQKDIAFQPRVTIVPAGASVSFPNRDRVRHHVYSFSPAKKFELKLYGHQESHSVTFDRPGVIALGCNIHDSMTGFIIVTGTPFAAQTSAAGRVVFDDVPAGAVTLKVWHPSIRARANILAQAATVGPQGLSTTLALRK
ncbi:MAG: methylamine utilization protein [Sphingobium sp.]